MGTERWPEVERIYHDALQLPERERSSFVTRACGEDQELRAEVESLLKYAGKAGEFMRTPALDVIAQALASDLQDRHNKGTASMIGRAIGEYQVVASLGSGGMGEVYRALDVRLGRDVAIKVLPAFLSADRERLRRFEQEARAAAALSHPNILAVFQMGTHDGAPYLVSELLEGETLRDQIKRGRLPIRKAIDYGIQIAHGLAAAHEKGIVHRDLKPENIFVTKNGRVKILDFGLAKLTLPIWGAGPEAADETAAGLVMGTAGYMSPEQVRGTTTDHRSDIFAFGAILYEMLAGNRVFRKPTPAETMAAILNEDPPGDSQLSSVSPGLQRVVQRCLEKNPEQRFQSASDLAFALEALSDSSALNAPAAQATRLPRVSGRLWLRVTVVAATLLVAFALWWLTPLADPKVLQVFPITTTARLDYLVRPATDGARIFYVQRAGDHYDLMQASVSGGDAQKMPAPMRNTLIWDVSPDGSRYLITSFARRGEPSQLWSWPVTGSSPVKLDGIISGSATYSPDGKLIAYHSGNDLWVANADGSAKRKVGSFSQEVDDPAWSTDSDRLRFTLKDQQRTISSIWEMRLDGSHLREIVPPGTNSSELCCGTWTPDGRYFIFVEISDGARLWALREKSDWLRRSPPGPFLLLSEAQGSRSPVVARDGKHIYFYNNAFQTDLHTLDLSTHEFNSLLSGLQAMMPAFSRDGNWIAFPRTDAAGLWRSRLDGTDLRQLTEMKSAFPRWSPDGKTVVFSSSGPGMLPNDYVVDADGGRPAPLVPGHDNLDDPDWSPDGSTLVAREDLALTPGGETTSHLVFVEWSNRQLRELPGSSGMSLSRWSPDGRWIAAVSGDRQELELYDVARSHWRTEARGKGISLPVWSGDSAYLYYQDLGSPGEPLRRVKLSSGADELLADFQKQLDAGVNRCIFIALTPDAKPVVNFDRSADIHGATVSLW